MKYDLLYHGTTVDNLQAILKQGIQPVPGSQRVWWDSHPDRVYAWSQKYCDQFGEGDPRTRAEESGMLACSATLSHQIVVFEARVSEKLIEPDCSGGGMDESGAVEVYEGIPRRYLQRYWISEDISLLLPLGHVFPNMNYRRPEGIREWVAEHLKDLSVYWFDAPIEWEEHSISQSKRITNGQVTMSLQT